MVGNVAELDVICGQMRSRKVKRPACANGNRETKVPSINGGWAQPLGTENLLTLCKQLHQRAQERQYTTHK